MEGYLREQRHYKFDGSKDYFAVEIKGEDFTMDTPQPIQPTEPIDPETIDIHRFVPLPIYNKQRWSLIQNILTHIYLDCATVETLYLIMQYYNESFDCSALKRVINNTVFAKFVDDEPDVHPSTSTQYRPASDIIDLLRRMVPLALAMKRLFPKPIPLLLRSTDSSLTLSQEQCACLLANAFFCTFEENLWNGNDPSEIRFNDINFKHLYYCDKAEENNEKLKCLLYYFYRVTASMPTGTVTFMRTALGVAPLWHVDNRPLGPIQASDDALIEDREHEMHVDFANEFIGGGVLTLGSVQEEIRFLICPEMIVSCLVCERMDKCDAIRIIGAERYSNYVGYAQTLEWRRRPRAIHVRRDKYGRFDCELVAIDALRYRHYSRQYEQWNIRRELFKAFSGFSVVTNTVNGRVPPIATGNWGCGAFNGDRQLKCLIQWMAASRAKRELTYLTFGHRQFADEVNHLTAKLREADVRIRTLYEWIVEYEIHRTKNLRVFDYIYRKLEEMKTINKALAEMDARKTGKESKK